MPDTVESVQQVTEQQVSTQEPTASTTQAPTGAEPLTAEAVQKMIAAETARVLAEAKEAGRRELQSQQDRNRAEALKLAQRARTAETSLSAVKSRLSELDPETAKDLELSELRAQRGMWSQAEQEEQIRQQQAEFQNQFRQRQTQYIQSLGLDPGDKRIDWADDAANYLDAMTRTLNSVAQLQKEQVQTVKAGLEKRLSELQEGMKKLNIDVNSVSTTASQGAGPGSDADFLSKFADGTLPLSKENMARYKKIHDAME